ncbi:uncharacterized protein LY89DRAFT_687053 [Mollisia scopiformis]|uniref:Uncharacterized protein n=1 Tax=Mollisia scopiformis TaxID=149040 RepID=A0A194X0C5_MOLSC|nr:uncharacterized protein LY89DRAFT_687053 [Mollisia scopiformis]KUJ13646.1 hypothetical protein LY89DRAFT_687053 [Mollisia scopiformis]
MRPRLPIRRILFLRPFRPPNSLRPFTQNTLISKSRPQLPFLSSPNRRPIARFLTTERKQWIKDEVRKAGKYTAVIWTGSFLLLVIAFGVQQEWLERKFPSPHEWSWVTRKDYRSARWNEDHDDDGNNLVDWARTGEAYRRLLKRLEDPNIDGAGLDDVVEGGILVAGVGKTGYDISMKPESWRRGYYEIMMGAARAAEHLDGWVRDRTRNVAFPASVVIGPSNPNPRPVPPGAKSPPREEDCEPAFESPDTYYMKILTTHGFTEKQRVDAALACGSWLDYKQTPEAASQIYQWALDIATSSSADVVDSTAILHPEIRNPSANILSATTALAVHHALNKRLSEALPIFISVLRARRTLQDVPATMRSTLIPDEENDGIWKAATSLVRSAIVAPAYPPPPDDGTAAPLRGPKERCEEAGIMTYIGEILYASKQSRTSREDGLAWTREAVDIAEEELRRKGIGKDAKITCKQCLAVGLGNWMTMVTKMAKEEKEKQAANAGSWLAFGIEQKDGIGRWESEEQVIKERMRRSAEILATPGKSAGSSNFLTV